ncbi:hypothetical protein DPMN_047564 [Dreissena polymorpha]|uniref:Uncharacterized protein n=1 Tax=Dreissena polymorpha TaxID=45954 RepID=A0A9D4D920_DREPO|nr:hypothetical protein DPMN_047564 [Dreissena polymorpha]
MTTVVFLWLAEVVIGSGGILFLALWGGGTLCAWLDRGTSGIVAVGVMGVATAVVFLRSEQLIH